MPAQYSRMKQGEIESVLEAGEPTPSPSREGNSLKACGCVHCCPSAHISSARFSLERRRGLPVPVPLLGGARGGLGAECVAKTGAYRIRRPAT